MLAQSTTNTNLIKAPWFDLSVEAILQTVWQGRTRLLLITAVSAGIGVIVALCMQAEYVSEAKIMPEMSNGSGDVVKRLASVAGLAGMDFSEAEAIEAVRPDLYPNVLQSTPFILHLIDQRVTTKNEISTTVGECLAPRQGWSLKQFLGNNDEDHANAKPLKPNAPVQLTAWQKDLADDIEKRVGAKLDTRSGIITITAKMPDAYVAAQVAQLAMNYLTQYVISYRTEKARQDLQFYTQRLNETRRRYQTAQFNVFHYNDQHKYFVVQAATMDKQRMEAELSIAQTVYTELSRQYEQAKLKVQERTPVFKVLEPPQVPLKRISPKRTVTVLLFTISGLLLSVMYLLLQQANLKHKLSAIVHRIG